MTVRQNQEPRYGYVDLHMHSTSSDGTDRPEDLISCVKKAGIRVFSLTDHDAISGCETIYRHLYKKDSFRDDSSPLFIPGVEFSCKDSKGKYHILGYGYDMKDAAVKDMVDKAHSLRMDKVRMRLDFLAEQFDFRFEQEDLDRLLALPNPGKPHIGNMMVQYGYANTKEEAIDQYINKKKTPDAYLEPEEAIRAILNSGGIPVLAHPVFGSGGERIRGVEMEERLIRLMDMGLAGVEAYYSGFSPDMIREMLSLADKYDLLITAGSDYHGRNKPVYPGQTNMEAGQEIPAAMKHFFELVGAAIYL